MLHENVLRSIRQKLCRYIRQSSLSSLSIDNKLIVTMFARSTEIPAEIPRHFSQSSHPKSRNSRISGVELPFRFVFIKGVDHRWNGKRAFDLWQRFCPPTLKGNFPFQRAEPKETKQSDARQNNISLPRESELKHRQSKASPYDVSLASLTFGL